MAHRALCLLFLSCIHIHYSTASSYGQQSQIEFPGMPQAQRLWDDETILGDSTYFEHPVSLGTFTNCDEIEISNVFDDDYNFLPPFDVETVVRDQYREPHVRVVSKASYRSAKAQRTVDKGVLSPEGCVMACITEKDFVCRTLDYFISDGGKCALYNSTGLVFQENEDAEFDPLYVGANGASNHYIVYKRGEEPPQCAVTNGEYAHSYFALGWKAMETGWYTLAHYMLDEAIRIDPDFHLAYVGKMLSNENMGYKMSYNTSDGQTVSYKESMDKILNSADFEVKLSIHEQLLVKASAAFQSGADLNDGLDKMIAEFYSGSKDSIIRVVEGNANLLRVNTYQILNQLAKDDENVFALQLLTHNLNPYGNGKDTISEESQAAATRAVFIYRQLGIEGAWQIHADCTDIVLYYSEWSLGRNLLDTQRIFLIENTNSADSSYLLKEEDDYLIVHGLDVKYMSKALQRVNEHEILHFFELQLALFNIAESHLNRTNRQTGEKWQMIQHRMAANAYFSTYDYILDEYAQNKVIFEEDWINPVTDSSNDLALSSRAYYWAAAAVQRLRKGQVVEDIKLALATAHDTVAYEAYKTLIEIYQLVVKGTEENLNSDYQAANISATQAAELQSQLIDADFQIPGNEDSKEFRMLIPLGYQFEADMLHSFILNEDAVAALGITDDDVIASYKVAVETPPLNASRILYGYGTSLYRRDKDLPRIIDQPNPSYVYAFETLEGTWDSSDIKNFAPLAEAQSSVEYYFNLPESGCPKDFTVTSQDGKLCWGGYVIIGVAAGVVVIIVIIIGILCLRRKAKAPRRDKEKEGAFIFSGPNLSRQESFGSSSRIAMSTLNRRGSPEATPYASQTLSIQRPIQDSDYTKRSNTIGAVDKSGGDFEAYSSH